MGSVDQKSALMVCGDYAEAYEVVLPLYVLRAFGVRVDCVSPGKNSGEKFIMAVHDFLDFELYTESVANHQTLNSNFDEVSPATYDAVIFPGGRFTELLSADEKCVNLVTKFAEANKIVLTSCHSQLMLAAAGLLSGGVKCTAFDSLKPVIELAGGKWWQQPGIKSIFDITDCVRDGKFISTLGWPTYAHTLRVLFESLGAKISSTKDNTSVLFVCGDYVEDYAINVPFKALQALGCKVEAVTPNKKRGESVVTAIYHDEGGQIPSEKRGHNFFITADWDEAHVDYYDCIVVPGGRSPELLVMNEKAVGLVKQFAEKDKFVAAVGQGKWLLAAAGVLKGKRCASSYGMKVTVKLAGGEVVESDGCVSHGKLVTAAASSDLPAFVSQLSTVLGLSVVF